MLRRLQEKQRKLAQQSRTDVQKQRERTAAATAAHAKKRAAVELDTTAAGETAGRTAEKTTRVKRRRTTSSVIRALREETEREALERLEKKRLEAEETQRKREDEVYPEGTIPGDRARRLFFNMVFADGLIPFDPPLQRAIKAWTSRLRDAERRFLRNAKAMGLSAARRSFKRPERKCYDCGASERCMMREDGSGDEVCTACGLVLTARRMDGGDMYRSFEGEDNRSHHDKSTLDPRLKTHVLPGAVVASNTSAARKIRSLAFSAAHTGAGRIQGEFSFGGTTVAYAESEKRRYMEALDSLQSFCIVPRRVLERAKWLACRARDVLESIAGVRAMLTGACLAAFEEFGEEVSRKFLCRSCKGVFEKEEIRDTHHRMCSAKMATEAHLNAVVKREAHLQAIQAKRRKKTDKKYPGLCL